MALKEIYQHIVLLVLLGLLCVIILSPSFFILYIPIALVYIIILLGPLQMALMSTAQQAILGEKVGVRTFFKALKEHFLQGLTFSTLFAFFLFIVFASWWYWGQVGTYLTFILACFQTYFVAMILVSQIYTVALHVKYKHSLKESMLISLKLLVRYPLYTLGAFAQLASLALLLGLTVVGFLFLFPGVYTILSNLLTANVIAHFDPSKGANLALSEGK